MVTRLPELSWKRQRLTHFFTKHGVPLKLQKVGSARRMTHLVQSPFCNGRVSLQAGPKFLCRHFTRFPFKKIPVSNFRQTTCSVEGTFQLHRSNQSHREFGYRACSSIYRMSRFHYSSWCTTLGAAHVCKLFLKNHRVTLD